MENTYFAEVKKLIEVHKSIQERNSSLLDIIQAKATEIENLKEGERKLKNQVRETLENVVNVADISSQYITLKEEYCKLLHDNELLGQTLRMKDIMYEREKEELLQAQEKHNKLYADMVNKEREKYTLKEKEFSMELSRTGTLMNVRLEQAELKWKGLLEEANRKLKESNISCNHLRSQLHQMNQKAQYAIDSEKRVRELEHKLDFKENELRLAQQAYYNKCPSPAHSSPPKQLYRTNAKKCSYRSATQTDSSTSKSKSIPKSSKVHHDDVKYVPLDAAISGKGDVVDTTPVKETSANRKFKKRKLFDPNTFEYPLCPDEEEVH